MDLQCLECIQYTKSGHRHGYDDSAICLVKRGIQLNLRCHVKRSNLFVLRIWSGELDDHNEAIKWQGDVLLSLLGAFFYAQKYAQGSTSASSSEIPQPLPTTTLTRTLPATI